MKIAVLGSTGKTGRWAVLEALRQGHDVVAIARTPAKLADLADSPRASGTLTVVEADVFDKSSIAAAAGGADALVSALGSGRGDDPATLTAGADAVAPLGLDTVIWMGALGVGPTKGAPGPLFSPLFELMLRREIPAKRQAEETIRAAGGTVVQAPILSDKDARGDFTLIPAEAYRSRLLFASVSRAEVARLLVAEAAHPTFGATTAAVARR